MRHGEPPLPLVAGLRAGAAIAVASACLIVALAPHRAPPPPAVSAVSWRQPEADESAARQPQEEPEVNIVLLDGRIVSGLLVSRDSSKVVVRIAGIPTSFDADLVDRVMVLAPVLERYERIRETIDDRDADRLLVLVEWLIDRRQFEVALREVEHVLTVQPSNPRARELKHLVESQLMLVDRARGGEERAGGDGEDAPRAGRTPFPHLTPYQINLIKVYETDLADPPKLQIQQQVITRLMDEYAGHELIPTTREGRAAMLRMPPARILDLMFRLRARQYYGEVQVQGEPKSMRLFRDNVHGAWLINSCATANCHGGPYAGRLWLSANRRNAEDTIYTNFLILERFRLADGTPLIDYDAPARSPLLQMGLPREDSLHPHPLVATGRTSRWRPVFRTTDEARYRDSIAWINSMYRPRPEYPIEYTPPKPPDNLPLPTPDNAER
ncbi:MAG: hypothetical protein AMXMBFR77_14190 [Phycisphaerales bacterium]|nr:MAG: hypothetical protein BroJett004_14560 [Planctomycetota bacterium]